MGTKFPWRNHKGAANVSIDEMMQRHGSKYDLWLVALIGGALLLGGLVVMLFAGKDIPNPALRFAIGFLPTVVTALFIYPLYYQVQDGKLLIRSGIIRMSVPVDDIVKVAPTNSSLSAPAMSLDRMDIAYQVKGKVKHVMISPADRMAFLNDLAVAAPQLRRAGEELVPR